jgi:hypothetical protein
MFRDYYHKADFIEEQLLDFIKNYKDDEKWVKKGYI